MVRLSSPSSKRVLSVKSKKVVLFIVEGPSDMSALHSIMQKLFDESVVQVQVAHGDVTSERNSKPQNIVNKVHELIKNHMKRYHFLKDDMLQVVHLMDTDGAYVSDDAITEVPTVRTTTYSTDKIIAADRQEIIARNARKRANMNRLALESRIAGIPYLAVYMSCNLDHVLYNKINSSNSEKRSDSIAFARKYKNNIEAFISFIGNSDFSVPGNRNETWEYIRCGNNSLCRHTNLGLCFPINSTNKNEPENA